jgi:hyperosmotically inducible periplasmic protein
MKLSIIAILALLASAPLAVAASAQDAPATQARPTDEQLSQEIATKIANHKTLSADAIHVNVEAGVVTLTGMVGKDADKATAEQLARVPGVTRVENKLTSRQKPTDAVTGTAGKVADATKTGAEKTADASKKAAKGTKKAVSKTGEVITDGWITSRIKTKFMADEALRASAIDVDTDNSVVTLHGAVPTEAARAKALALAKEVEGVDKVVDDLKVVASKQP